MQEFSGLEYICIDIANQHGLDKLLFEERIQWVKDNYSRLEALAVDGDEDTRPQYLKAVQALREVVRGETTGHLVGFDGVCSGVQLMAAMTGCYSGADATGLVNPNRRADAYTQLTAMMNTLLGSSGISVKRGDAKDALMTFFYGSKRKPREIFGEKTIELATFYEAAEQLSPGAFSLLNVLVESWNPSTLAHDWYLPDGYLAHVKVIEKFEKRIEIDEFDHSTFTYTYYENTQKESSVSNAANIVHSVDAYVLRNMHRRCNYDKELVLRSKALLEAQERFIELSGTHVSDAADKALRKALVHYEASNTVDTRILELLNQQNVVALPTWMVKKLLWIIGTMLEHEPFPIVTIHDEFQAHPNYVNYLRKHYRNIVAELSYSNTLDYLLSQLYGQTVRFNKYKPDLYKDIMKSNYFLS